MGFHTSLRVPTSARHERFGDLEIVVTDVNDEVLERGRALVVVTNKWDGLSAEQRKHVRDQLDRRLDPADAQAGEQRLAEGAHGDGALAGIELRERRRLFAGEAQLALELVFQHRHVGAGYHVHQRAALLGVETDELSFGPSTTQNTYVLANAVRCWLTPGEAIVVTNQDHEANSGPWRRLAEEGRTPIRLPDLVIVDGVEAFVRGGHELLAVYVLAAADAIDVEDADHVELWTAVGEEPSAVERAISTVGERWTWSW